MFYFIISLRNLKKRKLRTFLTLVGVILGVAVILAVNASGKSTVQSYEKLINKVSGQSQLEVTTSSPVGFDQNTVKKIDQVETVQKSYPSITKFSIFFKNAEKFLQKGERPSNKISFVLMAIDSKIDRQLREYKVKKGSFLKTKGKDVLLVDEFAKDNGLKVGSTILVQSAQGPVGLKVKGLLKKVGPALQQNGNIGFINLKTGQELFRMPNHINKADVKLKTGRSVGVAKKHLEKELGSVFDVERPASRSKDADRLLKSIKLALNFFGLVAIFVGGFLIFNTFSMNLAERSAEIASLRSIGASRLQIMILILSEALIIGLIGSFLGLLLGRYLAAAVFSAMISVFHTFLGEVTITRTSIITAGLVGIVVSLVSAFMPARRAGKISPIAVFKQHSRQKSIWIEKGGWVVGLILIILSIILALYPAQASLRVTALQVANFGILIAITLILPPLIKPLSFVLQKALAFIKNSKIASRNLPRAKLRSALTISALMVGLVMVIGIEAMNISYQKAIKQWINSSVDVDLFVEPKIGFGLELGQNVPMDISLEKPIAKTKGVKALTPVKFLTTKLKNQTVTVIARRPEKARRIFNFFFVEGNSRKAYDQLEKSGNIFISSTVKDNFGYGLGDTISIKTAVGKKRFKVVGVISDFLSETGTITISWSDLQRFYKTNNADAFDMDIKKGFTIGKVKENLEKKLAGKGLFVLTSSDIQKDVNKDIVRTFYLMDAIVFIALIVASFGIVNTLTMSVMERKREIAILRSVGAYASQISIIIMVEALIIGLIGAFIGALGGLFAAYFMILATSVLTGFPIPFILPGNAMVLAMVAAVVLSTLAGIYPAYRAAKTNIIQSLQYE